MGPEAAVEITHRRDLDRAGDSRDALLASRVAEYRERFANPYVAASHGFIDEVIEPRVTRPRLISALRMLDGKQSTMPRRKHGNIPL
jgi:propionyl-CoA carboxylase beta chain